MLVVKVEIWPFGDQEQKRTLGLMKIVNLLTHPKRPALGNYGVTVVTDPGTPQERRHETIINGFARAWGFWALVGNAVSKVMGDTVPAAAGGDDEES